MTSFSKSSARLKLDFYESGVGDTIVVTFPSGGLGLIDAHPSQYSHRPNIRDIVQGKILHFVCLTHPHADHGVDLVPVIQEHPNIAEFWHTIFEVPAFIYGAEQAVNFPSPVREFAAQMNQDWGEFFFDLLYAVIDRRISRHLLRSDQQPRLIDGVEVHCIGPDESVQNSYFNAYVKKLNDPSVKLPDPNSLSAILALKFGQAVVLLGADALKANWVNAANHYRKRRLAKACVLKVPHHGARNSFDLQKHAATYLDLCSRNPDAKAVLFAGDAKHPDSSVYEKLRNRTEVFCLSNGLKGKQANANPLRINIPGARAVSAAPVCNPVVSFEIDENAIVATRAGQSCEACAVAV
ncbi:MAG: hypothetical protein ABSH38_14620 [Verrucomicrobiota bacterium]